MGASAKNGLVQVVGLWVSSVVGAHCKSASLCVGGLRQCSQLVVVVCMIYYKKGV